MWLYRPRWNITQYVPKKKYYESNDYTKALDYWVNKKGTSDGYYYTAILYDRVEQRRVYQHECGLTIDRINPLAMSFEDKFQELELFVLQN